MLHIVARALVVYAFVLASMRLMGKREIGNLSPFDLVVAITIAELGALPLQQQDIPLTHGIAHIVVLALLHVVMAAACLKYQGVRRVIIGEPTVIIENGKIISSNMKRLRYNINDVMTQLRGEGYFNVADVEFAVLEPSGSLSVLPKSQARPVTPRDLGLPTPYEGPALPLVADGVVQYRYLKMLGLTVKDLSDMLQAKGVQEVKEVFFASIDSMGDVYVAMKNEVSLDELSRND
jgi:uncharacterized membrane protein YcaP (DUF421 family)